jgi:transcriptional regulator with XRE-family HTH domain
MLLQFEGGLMNIGNNIKNARLKLKFSRDDIQLSTGINKSYLGEIERNEKNPTIQVLLKIASFFNITVSELIGEKEPEFDYTVFYKKLGLKNKEDVESLMNSLGKLSEKEIKSLMEMINAFKE